MLGTMTGNTFFRFVWRFNAVAIAGVCLLAAVVGSYGVLQIGKDVFRERSAVSVVQTQPGASSEVVFAPDRFSAISGTSVLWSPIESVEVRRFGYSSKRANSVRNYVFLDSATGTSRNLLKANDMLILRAQPVYTETANQRTTPPAAIVYQIVHKDTNGDDLLTHKDRIELGASTVDGARFQKLGIEADKLLGSHVVNAQQLLLVTGTRKGNRPTAHAHYVNMQSFAVEKSSEINLPK